MKTGYESFRKKRILITGDTGFKGSWLAYWLHHLGADVYGFALPPERACDHFNLLGLADKIHHCDGDIRDLPSVLAFAEEAKPDYVFHLAAQPLVRRSYKEPKPTFDTNVGGTVNVLEVVRCIPRVKALVTVTSDKCYLNKEWCWGYRENDDLGGKDPYSASKAAAEIIFLAYQESFFKDRTDFGAASVRAGNVIGGGDWSEDRIVPDCIRALQANRPVDLRNPCATRPWQHVLEPLSGYLLLASRIYTNPEQFRGSYNFGPESRVMHTVEEVARALIRVWGNGEIRITRNKSDPPEAGLLHLNCDKAHQILGWHSRWNFERTVEETALWYKMVHDGCDAESITRRQIIEYMECEP